MVAEIMSGPPPTFSNQRRPDSLIGGQALLLAAAVASSAVFSFLYITGRPDSTQRQPPQVAQPAAGSVRPEPVPAPAGPIAAFEPTSIPVEQVIVVQPGEGKPSEKIIVRTPAMFATGSVQWSPEQVEVARALQMKLAAILRHQDALDRELERIETQWKALVQSGVPSDVLLPDSPSLPSSAVQNP